MQQRQGQKRIVYIILPSSMSRVCGFGDGQSSFGASTLYPLFTVEPATTMRTLNSTASSDAVICVYPISGQYGTIPRFLYYACLVFGVLGRKFPWLVAGALASAMTTSSTAVIHLIIITLSQGLEPAVQDLDLLAIFCLITTGSIIFFPALHFSSTLRESRAGPLILWWGTLNGIGGALCCVVFLPYFAEDIQSTVAAEISCLAFGGSTNGTLLQSASQLADSSLDFGNCTYTCFSYSASKIRSSSEILAVPMHNIQTSLQIPFLMFPGLVFILSFWGLLTVSLKYVPYTEQLENIINRRVIRSIAGRPPLSSIRFLFYYTVSFLVNTSMTVVVLSVIPVVIIMELYLLAGGGIPKGEEYYSVGQWAPFVGVGFVLSAGMFDPFLWRNRSLKPLILPLALLPCRIDGQIDAFGGGERGHP